MKIKNACYKMTCVNKSQYPTDNMKEILLTGRSNVGKSSFINAVLNNNKLARVSKEPGKTITLNFYQINNEFYFVDTPGYGYAKRGKEMIKSFGVMIEEYITTRPNLVLSIVLVDFRHKPTEDDVLMYNYFKALNKPVLVVYTKLDKVKRSEYQKNLKLIKETLGFDENDKIICFSSETKVNREELLEYFDQYIN